MDHVKIPKKLLKLYHNIIIGIDYIFVNGLLFFITVSQNIKFTTIEYVLRKSDSTTMKCLKTVINLYKRRGFKVRIILGDNEFESLKIKIIDKFKTELNPTSKSEYKPIIERQIRVVKKRFRTVYNKIS